MAPRAREFIQEKAVCHRPLSEAQRARNRSQSRVRSKVEHPFKIMKRVFGFTQVRYRNQSFSRRRLRSHSDIDQVFKQLDNFISI